MNKPIKKIMHAVLAAGLLVCGATDTAPAKIYHRWGRADARSVLSGSLPGKLLYESGARMNGIRGNARVEYYEIDFIVLRNYLTGANAAEAAHDNDTAWRVGGSHVLGTPRASSNKGARTLLIDLPDHEGVLCIRFQPGNDRRTAALPSGIPSFPGAAEQWWLELDRSGLTVYSATANAHPQTVEAHIARDLGTSGWEPALESSRKGSPSLPGSLYMRRNALLAFQVQPARTPGALTHYTIVLKQR